MKEKNKTINDRTNKQRPIKFLPKMLLYLCLGAYMGCILYLTLSEVDPNVETHFGFIGRTRLAELMVTLIPPIGWGLSFFIIGFVMGIVKWYQFIQMSDEDKRWHELFESLNDDESD